MPSILSARRDICVGLKEAPPAGAAPAACSELIVSQGHSRAPPALAAIGLGWHGSWNRAGHVRIEHSSGPVRPIARAGNQPRTPPPSVRLSTMNNHNNNNQPNQQ
jgi:hypothetical protein